MTASGAERLVGELRTLLRDHSEHTDTALVSLIQDMLAHYGFFDDADYDAAAARRAAFNAGVNTDDRAYDGWSCEPQQRLLTARERDIVTRILGDAVRHYQDSGEARVRVEPDELDQLRTVRWVINPRHD